MALEPIVLEGAFSALLGHGERSNVVQFHGASTEELSGHYDVAIVTAGLAEEVHPDLLITLPDTEAGGEVAIVTIEGRAHIVKAGPQEVVDLIAEHFPEEASRSGNVQSAAPGSSPHHCADAPRTRRRSTIR